MKVVWRTFVYRGYFCVLKMLERQSSKARLLRRQPSLSNINKHSCVQREKLNRVLVRQRTSVCLGAGSSLKDVNNNSNCGVKLSCKISRLLLKHTKLGFIESFENLSLNNCSRTLSESDELVENYPMPANIFCDEEITSRLIEKDAFELGEVLGSGGFGSVYMGTFQQQAVAVKVMHKYTKNPAAQVESFKAELHIMSFNHPNIVKTLAATHIEKFDEGAWVVMEYVAKGSLLGLLNDSDEEICVDRRLKFSIQIASALSYAHNNKVAHLDLKPANILLTEDDNCKIGDFGCSQKVEIETGIVSPTNRSILTGTFAYRAPELLRGEPPTFKADVYSYGVTLWQMRSRETPFSNQNQHVVIFGVVANGMRPHDPEPEEDDPFELSFKDLYRQCWSSCPLDRPSARELVELLDIWKNNM